MRVLVVDDDGRLRQVLARLLRASGFDAVDEAADGEEALLALGKGQPDLIITDFQMPRMDGIAFVRRIRAEGNLTPVIMLSGHEDPHSIVVAIKAGVSNYLLKPINPEVLFEKIGQTLGISKIQFS